MFSMFTVPLNHEKNQKRSAKSNKNKTFDK